MTLTRLSGAKSLRDPLISQLFGEWGATSRLAKSRWCEATKVAQLALIRNKQIEAVKQYASVLFPAPELIGLFMDLNVPKCGFRHVSEFMTRRGAAYTAATDLPFPQPIPSRDHFTDTRKELVKPLQLAHSATLAPPSCSAPDDPGLLACFPRMLQSGGPPSCRSALLWMPQSGASCPVAFVPHTPQSWGSRSCAHPPVAPALARVPGGICIAGSSFASCPGRSSPGLFSFFPRMFQSRGPPSCRLAPPRTYRRSALPWMFPWMQAAFLPLCSDPDALIRGFLPFFPVCSNPGACVLASTVEPHHLLHLSRLPPHSANMNGDGKINLILT